jgi:GNAT superfamily N-acetyltransferase
MRKPRWKRLRRRGNGSAPPAGLLSAAETLLRERERFCVSACSRYLNNERADRLWVFPAPVSGSRVKPAPRSAPQPAALLLYAKQSLYPICCGRRDIPVPHFFSRLLHLHPPHAIQGLVEETALLEEAAAGAGLEKQDQFDYNLMSLDKKPISPGIMPGLRIYRPDFDEIDELFPLQAAYEQEEVIPAGGIFRPEISRLSLVRIIGGERILAAKLNGKIVGKINCNARSFTRFQIGGVYVHPDCRGLGIATALTAAMTESLFSEGQAATLFGKMRIAVARAVYERVGFVYTADYRISYYKR